MGYSQENGYVPTTIDQIMLSIMGNINTQFAAQLSQPFTIDTFQGTGLYKYFYALAQEMQANEVATSEIFLKLQGYFDQINAKISRPVTTNPGIIEKMAMPTELTPAGYIVSVKPMIEADAGKINICVDTDDTADNYDAVKLELCTMISLITVGGAVTQGDQTEAIVLDNGQSFDFKFKLPNRIPVWLRLTNTLSENNQVLVGSPDDVKLQLVANIKARYRLGRNFEPQRYYSVIDAPWTSQVKLEWTDDVTDGVLDDTPTWHSEVYDAAFDDLFDVALERITLVED